MVNWHDVTPFSRMLAIIVFVGLIPALFFYLGMQYQDMQATKNVMRAYDFPLLQHYQADEGAEIVPEASTTTP